MFKINGKSFDAGIVSLQRGISKELKYSAVTEDGHRHSEVKALYPVYNLMLGNINQTDYDTLRDTVNTYSESMEVTLPDGQKDITFEATVELGQDGLIFMERDGTRRWDGLALTITGVKPIER